MNVLTSIKNKWLESVDLAFSESYTCVEQDFTMYRVQE